jgi:hypothetical protein
MNMRRSAPGREAGKYTWQAKVACTSPKGTKTVQEITVLADDRTDAVRDACSAAQSYGYRDCTINHITRI